MYVKSCAKVRKDGHMGELIYAVLSSEKPDNVLTFGQIEKIQWFN